MRGLALARPDIRPERRLDEGVSVEEVEGVLALRHGGVFEHGHAVAQFAGDPGPGGACAIDDDAVVSETVFGDVDGRHDCCERDCACTMDEKICSLVVHEYEHVCGGTRNVHVVVKDRVLVVVYVKQSACCLHRSVQSTTRCG